MSIQKQDIFSFMYEKYHLPKTVKLFESFSGIGCQRMAFDRLGIEYEMVGISEIDKHAILSYGAIHTNMEKIEHPYTKQEMVSILQNKNVGYDFKTKKHTITINKNLEYIESFFIADQRSNNFGDISKIKGSDLPEIDVFTYSFPCFTENSLVMTNFGFKKIVDVNVGDKVLTHDNTFKSVIRNIDNGLKETIKIKGMSIDEIVCTPNHLFYTRELTRVYFHNPNTQGRKFLEPKWTEAKKLNKNTYLGVAINQKSIIPKFNQPNRTIADGRVYKPKGRINILVNKNEFWYIVGRYIGDGWLRFGGGIIICCKESELSEITEKLEILDIHYNISKERTVSKIHIPLKEFGAYFEQFGKGASNKKLTQDILDLPIELLKSFLDGYLDADGCFTQGVYKASSVSIELIYGVAQCVAKAYKTPYRVYSTKRKPTCVIEGRTVNQKTTYCLAFKKETKKQDKAFYEDGYIWFPINAVEKGEIENVYDLEVKEKHSYTVNGVIVHNCTDLSKAGKQKGLNDTRSGLVYEVLRILQQLNNLNRLPKVLIMENVVDLVQTKFIRRFQAIQLELEKLGYSNYTETLDGRC